MATVLALSVQPRLATERAVGQQRFARVVPFQFSNSRSVVQRKRNARAVASSVVCSVRQNGRSHVLDAFALCSTVDAHTVLVLHPRHRRPTPRATVHVHVQASLLPGMFCAAQGEKSMPRQTLLVHGVHTVLAQISSRVPRLPPLVSTLATKGTAENTSRAHQGKASSTLQLPMY